MHHKTRSLHNTDHGKLFCINQDRCPGLCQPSDRDIWSVFFSVENGAVKSQLYANIVIFNFEDIFLVQTHWAFLDTVFDAEKCAERILVSNLVGLMSEIPDHATQESFSLRVPNQVRGHW